jgi:poly(A) polymerase
MIQKLIQRLIRPRRAADPAIIPLKKHGIAPERINSCALTVCQTLQRADFKAFVVGGAVRDLLMGKEPKDYDVATDATPEEVRHLFRRSRIIGRRFRIVHVMCGRDTIEVTTFRGQSAPPPETNLEGEEGEEEEAEEADRHVNENGRLLRDNVFGTQLEDAARRDFTMNALYYDPGTAEIWDSQQGVADIKHGVLRVIGDPETRYREDPVRMLRAVRLSAKLNLKLDPATKKPIRSLAELLQDVPKARLFDEMLKLFMSGHALESAKRLREEGLHHGVLPLLDVLLEQPMGERFVTLALQNTDERIEADKPVSPAFLFASLFWHEVLARWQKYQKRDMGPIPALNEAMDDVIQKQVETLAIPRRYTTVMREIWSFQPRFTQRSGQRPFRLLENPRFRAGFDFLQLRCASGEMDAEVGAWWEKFQHASPEERTRMLVKGEGPAKPRRRRRRKPSGDAPASAE